MNKDGMTDQYINDAFKRVHQNNDPETLLRGVELISRVSIHASWQINIMWWLVLICGTVFTCVLYGAR